MKSISIRVEFRDPGAEEQAWALAQFLKRIGWQEIRGNAVNDHEAYAMRDALNRVREGLQAMGYAPR